MTFKELCLEILYLLRKNGILGNLRLIAMRILSMGFPYYSPRVLLFKMDLEDRNRPRDPGDLIIRDGTLDDWLAMVGNQTEYRTRKYRKSAIERFNNGERLFVVEKNGRLIHYSWVKFTDTISIPEVETVVKLPQKAWYIYNSFTVEDMRRQGVYTKVLIHVAYELGDAGEKELLGYIMAGNIAAKSGIAKTGAWVYQRHRLTKFMGFTISKSSETLPKPRIQD